MKKILLSGIISLLFYTNAYAQDYFINYTYDADGELPLKQWVNNNEYADYSDGDEIYIEDGKLNVKLVSENEYVGGTYYQTKVMGSDTVNLNGSSIANYIAGGIALIEFDMTIDAREYSFKSDRIFSLYSSGSSIKNVFDIAYSELSMTSGGVQYTVTPNEVMHFKLKINLDSSTVDWSINENVVGSNIPFTVPDGCFDRIFFGSCESNEGVYRNDGAVISIDNLKVYRPLRDLSVVSHSENIAKPGEDANNDIANGEEIEFTFNYELSANALNYVTITEKNSTQTIPVTASLHSEDNKKMIVSCNGLKNDTEYVITLGKNMVDKTSNIQMESDVKYEFKSALQSVMPLGLTYSAGTATIVNNGDTDIVLVAVINNCSGTLDDYVIENTSFVPVYIGAGETKTVPYSESEDFVKITLLDGLPGLLLANAD